MNIKGRRKDEKGRRVDQEKRRRRRSQFRSQFLNPLEKMRRAGHSSVKTRQISRSKKKKLTRGNGLAKLFLERKKREICVFGKKIL